MSTCIMYASGSLTSGVASTVGVGGRGIGLSTLTSSLKGF